MFMWSDYDGIKKFLDSGMKIVVSGAIKIIEDLAKLK